MAENISANLKIIEEQTTKLNAAADSLAKAVRAIDEYLAAMNVGVTTYYTEAFFETPSDSITGDLETCRYYIGYDRDQDGSWGISIMCRNRILDIELLPKDVKEKSPKLASKVNTVRWIRGFDKCLRNVRLALCQYLPKVIEGLSTAVSNVTDSLGKSLKEIEGIQSLCTPVKK